jgi:hypothetical protein
MKWSGYRERLARFHLNLAEPDFSIAFNKFATDLS